MLGAYHVTASTSATVVAASICERSVLHRLRPAGQYPDTSTNRIVPPRGCWICGGAPPHGIWATGTSPVVAEFPLVAIPSAWMKAIWLPPPSSTSTRAAWAPYRQALRDITEQADPFSVVWPVAPG